MNPSLLRALGAWVKTVRSDLDVKGHGVALPNLPSCTIVELTEMTVPVSCGTKDVVTRDAQTHKVTEVGRLLRKTTNYRLTFQVPSSRSKNGKELLGQILDDIENAIHKKRLLDCDLVLSDAVTQKSFRLESMKFVSSQYIGEEADGEPVLYRGVCTVELARMEVVDKTAAPAISHVLLELEGA